MSVIHRSGIARNSLIIVLVSLLIFLVLAWSLFTIRQRSIELNQLNKKLTNVSILLNRFMTFERLTKKYRYQERSKQLEQSISELQIDGIYLLLKEFRMETGEAQLLDTSRSLFTRLKKRVVIQVGSSSTIDDEVIADIEVLVDSFQDYFQIVNIMRDRYEREIGRSFLVSIILILIAVIMSFVMTAVYNRISQNFRRSRESFHDIVDVSSDGIVVLDSTGNVRFFNPASVKLLGEDVERVLTDLIPISLDDEPVVDIPVKHHDKTDGTGELQVEKSNWEGKPAFLVHIRDITVRKKREEQIQASFDKIKVLVHELHHRIKNNLQLVLSMIRMPVSFNKDNMVLKSVLEDMRHRIYSIALIHEMFYKSDDFASINFTNYVKDLVDRLTLALARPGQSIEIDIDVKDVVIDIDIAIPCGIIINECITNSLKHAFADGKGGKISISFKRDSDNYYLGIADDGSGFNDNVDTDGRNSLGMTMITIVTENQLNGTVSVSSANGVRYEIVIPVDQNSL
jgi:two-component sensor histidine kinase/PAS domain-containing protein